MWIFHRFLWLEQQIQQISELQFDKFPTPSSSLGWNIRFRNQVATCSHFPSEAMLWIKEVEMVDSLDELKCSRSVAGKKFQNFDMLDAKVASAPNKIIQNSHFKKTMSASRSRKPRKRTGFNERNFHARHGRIETGAVVKSHKGFSGVEGRKSICYQWKEKGQCSKGNQCSVRHERNDRAQQNQIQMPPHLLSHQ